MLSSNFIENLGGGVQLEMIAIPSSSFQMGDNEFDFARPVHSVKVKPFYLGKHPITQEQYQSVMGTNPSHFKGAKLPVENVSWNDAVEFCKKLSQKTGKNYRLLSEAEWEYACRSGTRTKYHFGDDENQLGNYAWYGNNSKGVTYPVGEKKPNQFGLCDMHGNVWEWCSDIYHENYNGAPTDGSSWEAPTKENDRVLRGGSWIDDAVGCRSADRNGDSAGYSNDDIGFRVALGSA